MPLRKTESRLPAGLTAPDLGQTATAEANSAILLVSQLHAPLIKGSTQYYFVFITDETLAASVASYGWEVTENGTSQPVEPNDGLLEYTPQEAGNLSVSVRLLNNASAEVGTVALEQSVTDLNGELETLISSPESNVPLAGHPDTSREIINEIRMFVDDRLPPGDTEEGVVNKAMLAVAYVEALRVEKARRNLFADQLANSLQQGSFAFESEAGLGIFNIRPLLAAMALSKTANPADTYLPWQVFDHNPQRRQTQINAALQSLEALPEAEKIDLLNALRFPKAAVKTCKQVFETIKSQLFPGKTFLEIFNDESTATSFLSQFKEGPFNL